MRILIWHVHGGWLEAFVQGSHQYLLPAGPEAGPWWLGRGGRAWPDAALERSAAELADDEIDLVVLQRPEEIDACQRLTGRRPGRDLPAVYLEHNTPPAGVTSPHPMSGQSAITLVHVTHFNRVCWDNGRARVRVIEHGVIDPGAGYTGEVASQAVVINEPVRRWRVTGTDLLPSFATAGPLSVFGMGTEHLGATLGLPPDRLLAAGDLPTRVLHQRLASCRLYLHPLRWTSLGLALLEAMHLALPVVVLDTTEASRAVPPEAGAISTDVAELVRASAQLLADPDEARRRGAIAREAALARYGLKRFLSDWDELLGAATAGRHRRPTSEGRVA